MKKNKNPYPKSFAKRLTWRIMLILLVVMGFTSYIITTTSKNISTLACQAICEVYLANNYERVRRVLSDVYIASINRVSEIENNLEQPDKLFDIMKNIVETNPRIRSCGVSFIDSYYPKKGRWFCPYAVRDSAEQIITYSVGDAQHDYLTQPWFIEACQLEKEYWSKPFFEGNGSTHPLTSFLLPIHNRQGKMVAVLGVDLSLEWLSDQLGNIPISYFLTEFLNDKDDAVEEIVHTWDIYFFIIDNDGNYIVHPDQKKIIRENYLTHTKETKDTLDDQEVQRMLNGETNSFTDKSKNIDYTIYFRPVKYVNWSMAMVVPEDLLNIVGYIVAVILLILTIIALLVTFFVGRTVIRRAVKPVKVLADSANKIAQGNFNAPLPKVKHKDEICLLRDSFDQMQHSLTQYIEELKTTTAQKSAIESELKIAHDIQMSMLPKTYPPYPERSDVDIYGSLTPAKGVGGDLFDFYIRDEKLFFCIGDVSGKGIPAALVMAVTRSLFRNISSYASSPDMIVSALNNALADGNDTNMFVTIFVGVLDLPTGHLNYCNGGHNAPLLVGQEVKTLSCDPNLPAGIFPNYTFSLQEMVIDPQTTIFLFTDGLNEAENATHDQFGDERILEVAKRSLAAGQHQPLNIIYEMSEAVHQFVNHAEQSDDLTMLAIQYTQ